MRYSPLLSILLALLALGFLSSASFAVATPAVMVSYLEPGMNAQAIQLQSDGLQLILVSVDGQESFLVEDNLVLTDSAAIQSRLERHLVLASTFYPTLNESQLMLDRLQNVRITPEAKCAQFTAVDRFPCTDKTSCVKAAQANPQTTIMINADGFWEAMVDWQADRSTFNTSLNNLDSVMSTDLPTADSATRTSGSMAAVRSAFDQFMHNDLYRTRWDADCTKYNRSRCFEFCTRTNWTEVAAWSTMADRWSQISANLATLSAQSARAQALARTTSEWMNYSKSRQALWNAMSSELDGRQTQLISLLDKPNMSWIDGSLAASFLDWKSAYNQTKSSASLGRIRNALEQKPALLKTADNLTARISQNDASVKSIQNSLTSIRMALKALGNSNSTQVASLSASFSALQNASTAPIQADSLAALQKQASDLETLTLAETARAQLGAPPSSNNVSADAQVIISNTTTSKPATQTTSTPSTVANASSNTTTPPASTPTSSTSTVYKPAPFGLPCALPVAAMVFLLALASAKFSPARKD